MAETLICSSNSGNRNRKKIKTRLGGDDVDQNQNAVAVDTYTSQLPALVVHQILQTLPPKLAIRASILSKQWAQVWSLVPVLDFDYDEQPSCHRCPKRKSFFKFLRRCLKRCENDKCDLDKFRLHMHYRRGAEIINKWLNLAVTRNVKELDISLCTRHKEWNVAGKYVIPQTVLNAKSLTTLHLENVRIKDGMNSVSFPSLKTMSLKHVQLRNGRLISGCPSIECLSFTSCELWDDAKFSSSSLKSLEVIRCNLSHGFKVLVTVEAINLESFRFCGREKDYYYGMSEIDFFSCQTLRNLEFNARIYLGQWFEDEVKSRFPFLESLVLDGFGKRRPRDGSDTINIENQHVQRLVFCGFDDLVTFDEYVMKAKITTPSLLSFAYNIASLRSHLFLILLSNFSLNAPNLRDATINFNFNFKAKDFPPLLSFLGNFDCSGKLILSIENVEALIFPDEVRKTCPSPLPRLKNLKVVLNSSTAERDSVLKDSLQWMAPALGSLYINETEIFTGC